MGVAVGLGDAGRALGGCGDDVVDLGVEVVSSAVGSPGGSVGEVIRTGVSLGEIATSCGWESLGELHPTRNSSHVETTKARR